MLIGTEAWAGIVMTSLGLLILAFWTGYRVGRPSGQRGKG
ncbi:hypothetical protein ABIB26_004694 [Arthrobacter sp. UYEF20]